MTIPTLEGSRLRLEPLSRDHLPGLGAVAFDARIWRFMLRRVETPADLESWLDAALRLPGSVAWAAMLKTPDGVTARLIGGTRFLDLDLTHRTVEIGHTWLHPDFHGSGLNREAKLLQLRYAFEELGLHRVAFKTHHENLQSQAAIRALGAQYEGTFRNHFLMPDGSTRHSVWFSITREDWPGVKARLLEKSARSV
jgi:RimJ/RimL family protein N-acetyltransferase